MSKPPTSYLPPPDALSYRIPPDLDTSHKLADCYIFFITGNPGLIGYYEPFLSTLSSNLSSSARSYCIHGVSLAGFEISGNWQDDLGRSPPYGLEDVIQIAEQRLHVFAKQHGSLPTEDPFVLHVPKVILIGHSVGSYILLELLRRQQRAPPPHALQIIGGILLFPTVTHIGKSPSGVQLGGLLRLRYFALVVSLLVRAVTRMLPQMILYSLVKLVTRFPEPAARTTWGFIASPMGVRQALHMAKDEMESITEDKWDEEIWGAAQPPPSDVAMWENRGRLSKTPGPKLIFYFGEQDHWVANHLRDELIASRGGRTKMLIDQEGVPHGFCINHSELLAKKVKLWVEEITDARP